MGSSVGTIRVTGVTESFKDRGVCVLGLGYVGLTLAAAMANVGFKVLGVEIRDSVLDSLRAKRAPFHEPGLDQRLKRVIADGTFDFAAKIPSGWAGTVFIITVGTPLSAEGRSRMDMVENV